jgi:hypothetical protein
LSTSASAPALTVCMLPISSSKMHAPQQSMESQFSQQGCIPALRHAHARDSHSELDATGGSYSHSELDVSGGSHSHSELDVSRWSYSHSELVATGGSHSHILSWGSHSHSELDATEGSHSHILSLMSQGGHTHILSLMSECLQVHSERLRHLPSHDHIPRLPSLASLTLSPSPSTPQPPHSALSMRSGSSSAALSSASCQRSGSPAPTRSVTSMSRGGESSAISPRAQVPGYFKLST